MARLVDKNEMQNIYEYCVHVYNHELTVKTACESLEGKTSASSASRAMYFSIYACMRKGTCYKMGTSASFTRFLIERIGQDEGQSAMLTALASAKQNAEYRISCGNEQPGIEKTCRELIKEYNLPVHYEDLDSYYGNNVAPKELTNANGVSPKTEELKISISYGSLTFEAIGQTETVLCQLQQFAKDILPQAINSLATAIPTSTKRRTSGIEKNHGNANQYKDSIAVGKMILQKVPNSIMLSSKMDFKARMIPLLFLADHLELQNSFSFHDIQVIMYDVLGEKVEKKQIEDVLLRRAGWFEKKNKNPRTYCLLDIAKDYARNILFEDPIHYEV